MEERYPVIIVDDEPLARQAFKRLLADRFPGFILAGEADSGPGGVELFRDIRPPIVIMDIRIPGFDGLEASRIILKEAPAVQIIVLSAYDDFRYAQEALHDGVLGYLLKPVREDRLRALLEKAVEGIGRAEASERNHREIRAYRSLAERDRVASFIYGSRGGVSAEDFASLSDPPVERGYFVIFRTEGEAAPDRETAASMYSRLDRIAGCLPGEWMGAHLPVFVRTEGEGEGAWRSEAEFLCREISHQIRDVAGGRVRAGVGPVRESPADFAESFHMAFDALEEDAESRPVSFHHDRARGRDGAGDYPVEGERVFLEACRASDGNAAMAAAMDLVDGLISPEGSLMDSRFAVTEFLIIFRREWERISGRPRRRNISNLLREALLCPDHAVLREWFLLVVRDITRSFGETEEGDDFLLRKVRHFIDLNDLKDISLEAAADSVGITGPYLSRIFKEKTGGNFHDYVVERRLEASAALLRETNRDVQDIAKAVGYGDVSYFRKVFRGRYGSSPREYRQGST